MKNNLNILMTGAGGPAVSFMIKQIKKYRTCNIVAVDMNKNSSAFFLADKSYVVPSGEDPKFKASISKIIKKNRINIVISVVDEELVTLASLEKKLNFICIQPKKRFVIDCLDKYKFSLLQKKIGLNNLNTKLLSDMIKKNKLHTLKFPLILKPRFGRGSRNIFLLNNYDSLKNKIKLIKSNFDKWILQSYYKGDEYTVSAVCYNNKKNYNIVPKLIILKEGITKIAITKKNKDIINTCKNIINKLNPGGPFNVQCKFNKKTKQVYIFEINPRYSTSTTLTIASGIDEINLIIDNFLGNYNNLSNIKWKTNIKMIRNYTDYFSNNYDFFN